jgi:predicted nuclease with TOPRIM domain
MKVICPDCGCRFQSVDVDAVMAERKVIHELLAESRELAEVKAQRDEAQSMISRLTGELNRALDKVVELHSENKALREAIAAHQCEVVRLHKINELRDSCAGKEKSLPMMPEPLP